MPPDPREILSCHQCSLSPSYHLASIILFRESSAYNVHNDTHYRGQWLRGRASDSRLREPGFESCAVVLKPWANFFTLHCSSSLSCINEYLAIDSGGYVYEQL